MTPMPEIAIRPATVDDIPALRALAWRLAAFELPPWRTGREIADADGNAMVAAIEAGAADEQVFIAERGGTPAGCLHMLAPTDFFGRRHAHVSVVATTEEAEGAGVGRALMRHAEEWARQRGLGLLTLNMFAANARARRFYESAGFAVEMVKYVKPLE